MTDDAPEALRAWVREDFGVDLTGAEAVGHGADRHARLWQARSADGTRYAVKLSGGGSPAGLVVSAYLGARGVPGIAVPLRTRDGRLWSDRDGRRLSLVPWVSDARALGGAMTAEHWRAYGELLAAVHDVAVTDDLAALLPPGGAAHAAIVAAARGVDARLRGLRPGDQGDPLVDELARIWSGARGTVAALARGVERLGDELRDRPGPAVVCHGDPHLGNLLLGPEGRVWLIDWDDAVLAPRECDLMFLIGGVLAFAPVTAAQQAAAFAGYGRVDVDATRLAWFLSVRALDDIGDWSRQVLDAASAEADRRQALDIVRGLVSPHGLVTLADAALADLARQR
ncbi:phosphotransferase [Micromonospora sp. NPDC002717]|uniref:phosphotransferase enzyme family protein n=1 Tax=Micromonospora sp. NPDC002717 TaxID=3154424 RepID=UPI003321412A